MTRYNTTYRRTFLLVLTTCFLLLACGFAPAQEPEGTGTSSEEAEAPPDEAEATSEDAEATSDDAEEPEDDAEEPEDDGKVPVNLNNVDINHIVKFLSEITGKPVIKHKDVNVKITVISPEKVTPERAFELVSEALELEKIAVIRDDRIIKLIPSSLVSQMLIELLPPDTEELGGGIVRTMISVRFVDVEDIKKVVEGLKSETGTVVAHPASRTLIVTDTANRVSAIRDVVSRLDVLDTEQRQVKVFELKYANAEELAPILKSVLGLLAAKENGGGPPAQPGQPPRPPQPGQPKPSPGAGILDVVAYKSANWLIVAAPEEILEAAVSLVNEFDREKPKDLSLHFLQIEFADAEEIAQELARLFKKRPEKRVKDMVEITADARSSSLIVLSSEENFALIEDLVVKLDTEDSVQTMTKTYELEFADAGDIAEQMTDLYSGMDDDSSSYYWWRPPRRDDSKTRFVAESRTNSVIAIARPTEFGKIDELIKKLDVPIDADQVSPRIFRIKYVDAKEMTDVMKEVFGVAETKNTGGYYSWRNTSDDNKGVGRLYGKVRFVTETTTNSIIVTTNNKENFKIIESFIMELDTVSPDAGNVVVIPLKYAKAKELADELNALFAREGARMPPQQQGQNQEQQEQRSSYYAWLFGSPQKKETDKRAISNLIGQVRVVPDVRTNSLTITTAVQNHELLKKLIDELDIASPKVLVRVRLIEVTTSNTSRIGTRFSSDPTVFETDDLDNGFRSLFGVGWSDVYEDGTISASANIDIGLLIQFLQRNADTRILSEPTLTMNNNQPADIFVGSRIPFITNSQSTPEGTLTQSFEYRDAGTTLKITPNINDLDTVEMKVELESSQIRPGEVLFGGFIIDTRQFNTELSVKSGDTIVIGGILRESEAKAVRRVPILGRIPVANLLFRKKDKKMETTELIAFITPTVLRDPIADSEATKDAAGRVRNINEWYPYSGSLDPLPEEPRGWKKLLRKHEERQ